MIAATSSRQPASAASISMTSPWMRVESTSMTTSRLAAAVQPRRLRRRRRPPCARPPRRERARSRSGSAPDTCSSMRGDGVARQPHDAVDVGAESAIRPATAATTAVARGRPSTVTWTRPRARRILVGRPHRATSTCHAERGRPRDGAAAARTPSLVGAAEQHAEHEPAADHDLLDVEHGRLGPGQRA